MKCNLSLLAFIVFLLSFLPILFLLIISTIILLLAKISKCKDSMNYGWNLLISVDQLVNTIFLGDCDETISSRAGKVQNTSLWAKVLCYFLNKLDKNHCKESIEKDEGKDQII